MAYFSVTDPAPPKSLYAVNATHSAVTLLWTEEGVVDFYQVSCRQLGPITQLKVGRRYMLVRCFTALTLYPKLTHSCAFLTRVIKPVQKDSSRAPVGLRNARAQGVAIRAQTSSSVRDIEL